MKVEHTVTLIPKERTGFSLSELKESIEQVIAQHHAPPEARVYVVSGRDPISIRIYWMELSEE